MRSCSIFYKKICCIYTAFGVSQTPNIIIEKEEEVVTVEDDFAVEEEGQDGVTIACLVVQCK